MEEGGCVRPDLNDDVGGDADLEDDDGDGARPDLDLNDSDDARPLTSTERSAWP